MWCVNDPSLNGCNVIVCLHVQMFLKYLFPFWSSLCLYRCLLYYFSAVFSIHSPHSFCFLLLYYASHYHSHPPTLSFISSWPPFDNTSFSDLTQYSELKGVEYSLSFSLSCAFFLSMTLFLSPSLSVVMETGSSNQKVVVVVCVCVCVCVYPTMTHWF